MRKQFLLALLVTFSAAFVHAVSGVDAVDFIVSSNYFLYDGETYTPPNVAIKHGDKSYWVVPVTSGNDVITYFAVDSETGALSESRAVNRSLFEVADSLRELQLLKSSLSPSSGIDWLFTQKYQTIFNEMALNLNDSVFQLNTVEATLMANNITADVSEQRNKLLSMSLVAGELSSKISEASVAENSFFTAPSTETFSKAKESYSTVFSMIEQLNAMSLSYQSSLSKLNALIAVSALDIQTKAQLQAILRLPPSLAALRNYNLDSTQLAQALDTRFSSTTLRLDSLLEQLDNRIAKDRAHKLLYAENEKLKKETGFESLQKAKATILAPENKSLWENQAKVVELERGFSSAESYYSKKMFAEAEKAALKAIDDAAAVYKKGRKGQRQPGQGVSQDLLFKVAAILLGVLVLLYVFNNRGKLGGMMSGKKEELELYQ